MSIWLILVQIASVLIFLFFFWRRLKEDYASEIIFTTGFYSVISYYVASLLIKFLLIPEIPEMLGPLYRGGLWFWGGLVFGFLGLLAGIKRFNLRTVETIEASGLGFLFAIALMFLYHSMINSSYTSLAASLLVLAMIVIFYLVDSNYKGFHWYKSGKVGFSGLLVLGLFFLVRAFIAIYYGDMLSFVGRADAILSGLAAFTLFITLYNRARTRA